MSIFSVSEDFELNTIGAIPGLWAKLRYLSNLRQENGHYEHWGLARKYGKSQAERAIRQAHQELALKVLRTRLAELLEETMEEAAQSDVGVKDFVARLIADEKNLFPDGMQSGASRHFTTVVRALWCLAQACTDASPQAS